MQTKAPPAPRKAHGFELVEEQYVAEYASHVLLYRHTATGAQLMSLSNADENKTFGVTLRTPVGGGCGRSVGGPEPFSPCCGHPTHLMVG